MHYYKVLIEQNLPIKFLTYKSLELIGVGEIVLIPIRNKSIWGVIVENISKNKNQITDTNKIKEIKRIYPVKFSKEKLNFLFAFSYNTFNSLNTTLSSFLQPFKIIADKYWKNFDKLKQNNGYLGIQNSNKKVELDFNIERDITFRIRDIIRSYINSLGKDKNSTESEQLLILFPEIKYLNKIYKKINNLLPPNFNARYWIYSSSSNKNSRETVLNLIEKSFLRDKSPTLDIVFSTRNGIFLPFNNLQKIILIDESNSFYIQDQNSLYYDSRDVAFLMSNTFSIGLEFLSTSPSIRLYSFYSEAVFDKFMTLDKADNKKLPKITLIKRDKRFTFNNLFSESVLEEIGVEYKD